MESQLSELRDHVIDLRTRVGEHISGRHSKTLQQVDNKLLEILNLLKAVDQVNIGQRKNDGQTPKTDEDDLTLIQGISEELAKSLNSSNVSHFHTIADWTSDDVRHFGELLSIGFKIQKQNWIEQAKILSTGQDTSFSRKAKRGYSLVATPTHDSQLPMKNTPTDKFTETLSAQDARTTKPASELLHDQDISPILDIPDKHQEESSALKAVGMAQSFFCSSDSDSTHNSKTVDKAQGGNEKIGSETHKKEEHTAKIETIYSEHQTGSNINSDQDKVVTNEERQPNRQKLESTQKHQISSASWRKTFPDFRQFADSTLPDDSSASGLSDTSRASAQDGPASDDRGAMRQFFRAITKSEKS